MWNEIEEAINELNKTLTEYKKIQKDYAKKEYYYRTALSKRLIELRANGEKVTYLSDIARGMEDIAKLRFDRDIAQGLVKSAEEGINFYKLKIRELEAQHSREWGQAKFQ